MMGPHFSLTPLPTTTMEGLPAGLDYLQYPHTEAFGMPLLSYPELVSTPREVAWF